MARVRRWFVVAVVLGLGAALVVLVRLDARVRAYLAGPSLGSIRVYAAPTMLRPGAPVPGGSLARKLARLGYRAVATEPATGEYRVRGATVDLGQRPSPVPWAAAPRHVEVTVRAGRVATMRDADGTALDWLELEPEMLAALGGAGAALGVGGDVPPPACRDAALAAEDRHFFRHPGIDPVAVGRALIANLRAGARRQGGSTITQQLVKNVFLSPQRTLDRKAREAVLALLLEAHATKDEILRRYLASVYLGEDGAVPVHGFAQGAEVYFGKPLGDLSIAECALLAGMIRSPNGLGPRRHPRPAVARRNGVLAVMGEERMIAPDVVRRAVSEPLRLATRPVRQVGALYVADEVSRELAHVLPASLARAPGLAVFTAVDADAQREAERAVRRGLDALERSRGLRRARLEAALVALDPRTGRVRALVGGRDYGSSPLDRAVRTRRQPGSAFKPFVYLAALDPARCGGACRTVVSPLDDGPLAVRVGADVWRPANYDGTFHGTVPLEDALAESMNAATVRLALDVGLDPVIRAATDVGVRGPLPRVPALALGVAETSLLDLTAAYGVFASGGLRRPPALVVAVTSQTGETLYAAPTTEERALDPGVAYLVTHLLERVIDEGTGRPARRAGLTGAAAGKTGTTDDTRDAWFVGFTPEVIAGVWMGSDGGEPTGFTGAAGALPVWTDFVRALAGSQAASAFPVPDDVEWREVDPSTGLVATAACPERRTEPFLAGTAPRATCDRHRPLWTAVGGGVGRAVESSGRRLGSWLSRLFR